MHAHAAPHEAPRPRRPHTPDAVPAAPKTSPTSPQNAVAAIIRDGRRHRREEIAKAANSRQAGYAATAAALALFRRLESLPLAEARGVLESYQPKTEEPLSRRVDVLGAAVRTIVGGPQIIPPTATPAERKAMEAANASLRSIASQRAATLRRAIAANVSPEDYPAWVQAQEGGEKGTRTAKTEEEKARERAAILAAVADHFADLPKLKKPVSLGRELPPGFSLVVVEADGEGRLIRFDELPEDLDVTRLLKRAFKPAKPQQAEPEPITATVVEDRTLPQQPKAKRTRKPKAAEPLFTVELPAAFVMCNTVWPTDEDDHDEEPSASVSLDFTEPGTVYIEADHDGEEFNILSGEAVSGVLRVDGQRLADAAKAVGGTASAIDCITLSVFPDHVSLSLGEITESVPIIGAE